MKYPFTTSPPLVMYVASATQLLWPGAAWPTRLVQIAVFTVPVFAMVWILSRGQFGRTGACVSLAALLCTGYFLRETFRVRLDVPLACVSLATLWAFHNAVERPGRRRGWLAVVAVGVFASVWVKYQSVCIVAAMALFAGYLWITLKVEGRRRVAAPLAAACIGGVCGVLAVAAFFRGISGASLLSQSLAHNLGRLSQPGHGWGEAVSTFHAVAARGVHNLGVPLIVLALLGLVFAHKASRLAALLAAFCLATGLFNAWTFRMPGAGSYYLHAMVPALAILAGHAAHVLTSHPRARRHLAFIALLLAWNLAANRPPLTWPGRTPRPAVEAAGYVARHAAKDAGVLATDSRVEFYAGRPTAVIQYMAHEDVLASLEGRTRRPVDYVVLPSPHTAAPRDSLNRLWPKVILLLREHFHEVPLRPPGLALFERKPAPGTNPP